MKDILFVYKMLLESPTELSSQLDLLKSKFSILLHPDNPRVYLGIALVTLAGWIEPACLENPIAEPPRPASPTTVFKLWIKKRMPTLLDIQAAFLSLQEVFPNPILLPVLEGIVLQLSGFEEEALQKVAESSTLHAQYTSLNFQIIYAHERGLPLSLSKDSVAFLQDSSAHGVKQAHLLLGYCFKRGYGVVEAFELAVQHFRTAALLGNVDAMEQLNVISYDLYLKIPEGARQRSTLYVCETLPTSFVDFPPFAYFFIRKEDQLSDLLIFNKEESDMVHLKVSPHHAANLLSTLLPTPYGQVDLSPELLIQLLSMYGDDTQVRHAHIDLKDAAHNGYMHSQYIFASLSKHFLFTNPSLSAAEAQAQVIHIQRHFERAASQNLLIAQYQLALFHEEITHDTAMATHYYLKVFEAKPFYLQQDLACITKARVSLKRLLLPQFFDQLSSLYKKDQPIAPAHWDLLNGFTAFDKSMKDIELLPVWVVFLAILKLRTVEFKAYSSADPTATINVLSAQIADLFCKSPEALGQFEQSACRHPRFIEDAFKGWFFYIKGYLTFILDPHSARALECLKSANSRGSVIAASDLMIHYLKKSSNCEEPSEGLLILSEATRWAEKTMGSGDPNLCSARLWRVLSDGRLEYLNEGKSILELRQDPELITMMGAFVSLVRSESMTPFLFGFLCEIRMKMDPSSMEVALAYYEKVNPLKFSKLELGIRYFSLGEGFKDQIKNLPPDLAVQQKHLTDLRTCYEKAATLGHHEASRFLAQGHETGEFGLEISLKKAIHLLVKIRPSHPDDPTIHSKIIELRARIRAEERARDLRRSEERAKRLRVAEEMKSPPSQEGGAGALARVTHPVPETDSDEEEAPTAPALLQVVPVSVEREEIRVVSRSAPPVVTMPPPRPIDRRLEMLTSENQRLRQRISNIQQRHLMEARRFQTEMSALKAQYDGVHTRAIHLSDEIATLERQLHDRVTDAAASGSSAMRLAQEAEQRASELARQKRQLELDNSDLRSDVVSLRIQLRLLQEHSDRARFFSRPRITHVPYPVYYPVPVIPLPEPAENIELPVYSLETGSYLLRGEPLSEEHTRHMVDFFKRHLNQPSAMYNLGLCLTYGIGTPLDQASGLWFLNEAYTQGVEEALSIIEAVSEPEARPRARSV